MKKIIGLVLVVWLISVLSFAESATPKVILLISEQNIEGPQAAWWASEVDLSATEAAVSQRLIEQGFEVLEPSDISQIIEKRPAFRRVGLSESQSIKLGRLSKADYVILGKAVASGGANVPQSNMRSCFANVSAKLIRTKDGKVVAYLNSAGNSAHMDAITGGKEALVNAALDLSAKLIDALNKQGGK